MCTLSEMYVLNLFIFLNKHLGSFFFLVLSNYEFISSKLKTLYGKSPGSWQGAEAGRGEGRADHGVQLPEPQVWRWAEREGAQEGFAWPLHPVQQILVMIREHPKSQAESYLCYLLLLWDLVSEPQFINLQNGSHNKLLDDTRRGWPWVLSLKVTRLLGCDTPLLTCYWGSILTATKPEMKSC